MYARQIVRLVRLRSTSAWCPTRSLHCTAPVRAAPLPDMRQQLTELAKNPKAMHIFQTIQKDPRLLNEIEALGRLLLAKGYISANDGVVNKPGAFRWDVEFLPPLVKPYFMASCFYPLSSVLHISIYDRRPRESKKLMTRPCSGPIIMMKMFADSEIRARMLTVAKLLKDAGALDADGKGVDPSNMIDLLMGATSQPPPPASSQPQLLKDTDPAGKSTTNQQSSASSQQRKGVADTVKGFFTKK
ncbi:hypothetical protein DFJ77DRAFT_472397 [Powellomyces hirtus]|nr:hypothetical protein DFJ77DRAFT_472397 [Powellomyces hirtus]